MTNCVGNRRGVEATGGGPLELAEYGRAIVRGWLWVLAGLLAGLGAAALVTASTIPMYQSAVKFYVVSHTAVGQSPLQSLELSRGRVAAYASLIESDSFIRQLFSSNSSVPSAEVEGSISASANQDTRILTVVVSLPDPAKATQAAQTIASRLSESLRAVEAGQTKDAAGQTDLNVVGGPTASTDPVSPRVGLNLGLGALLGLGAGIVLVVSRRLGDKRLRTPAEVEEAAAVPVLARIPAAGEAGNFISILQQRPASGFDEAARRLRTNIDHLPAAPASAVLVITSATPGEGKSTVALMLARAWAEAGERTLLVEADLHKPQLARDLGLPGGLGLTDVLAGRSALKSVIQHAPGAGFDVVAAGAAPDNPTELIASRSMTAVLGEMRGSYTRVIIDAPALQPLSDAALLAVRSDSTVMVVMYQKVSRELLRSSLRNLELVKGRVSGAVLTALPRQLAEAVPAGLRRSRLSGARRKRRAAPAAPVEPQPVTEAAGKH